MPSIVESAEQPLSIAQQELFCQLFTSEEEFFGDGVESYIEAYDVDKSKPNWRNTAQCGAKRLLKSTTILQRIDYLLQNKLGFNDQNVDKQLAFLIAQSADLKTKLAAIREYNALKGRIKHKLEIDVTNKSLPELDREYEELDREIALAQQILQERQASDAIPAGMPLLTEEQRTAVASGQAAFMPKKNNDIIT